VNWVRTDELDDAIDNLEMTVHFLESVSDYRRWKWAIISMHQALYGFAICSTTPSDSSLALKDPSNPDSQLISIWTALKRAKDPAWKRGEHSQPLVTSKDDDWAIRKLIKEFRNEFAHFRPKGWSIEVSGFPSIFKSVVRVIEHLALASESVVYTDEHLASRTREAIARIRAQLDEAAA
jgi:hypothetical protein